MALSAEQKKRNRNATNARNRAWHARYKERKAAEWKRLKVIDARYQPQLDALLAEENEIMAAEQIACADIDRQIAELQAKRKQIAGEYRAKWHEIHVKTGLVVDERNKKLKELEARLDQEFPDFVGHARSSPACWKPLTEFA